MNGPSFEKKYNFKQDLNKSDKILELTEVLFNNSVPNIP